MELGPQNHNGDGLLGPNSIIVVFMDPLGILKSFKPDLQRGGLSEPTTGKFQNEALNLSSVPGPPKCLLIEPLWPFIVGI